MSNRTLAEQLRDRLETDGTPTSSLSEIFEEQPPSLTDFVQTSKYLDSPALSDIQYAAVRGMEQIYPRELYPALVEEFGESWIPVDFANLFVLQWGKGSGKDHICRLANLRVINLLLCLRNPLKFYELPSQDSIHTLNVASSAPQANRAFFKPLKRAVERKGSWYADKADPKDGNIVFDKNIEAISGHSMADTLEGLNLIFATADEISAFPTEDERLQKGLRDSPRTYEAIWKMLRTSAKTRFPEVYKVAAISYPRFKGDAIQQLTARGKADIKKRGERSNYFVSGPKATWDVNPRVKSRTYFEEDYDDDPVMARTMYECDPQLSENPFFKDKEAVYACLSEEPSDPLEIDYEMTVAGWKATFAFLPSLVPIEGARYCLHGDIGITTDAAGVAMAHTISQQNIEYVGKDEEGADVLITEMRPFIKVDFISSFSASNKADPPREVQIRWYRELYHELVRRGFNVVRFTFDGFQSTETMQYFKSRGLVSERVSTDINNDVWSDLRDTMYDRRLTGPARLRAITEITSLSKNSKGKVDHPPYGSKDEADALGGAVYGAIRELGEEGEVPEEAYLDPNPITVGGADPMTQIYAGAGRFT